MWGMVNRTIHQTKRQREREREGDGCCESDQKKFHSCSSLSQNYSTISLQYETLTRQFHPNAADLTIFITSFLLGRLLVWSFFDGSLGGEFKKIEIGNWKSIIPLY
jgi:hypothetical protein